MKKILLFSLLCAAPASAVAGDEPLRLIINLPSYELEVWQGEEMVRSYGVTIGAPAFPTPTGGFQISRIEWNPSWNPPPSRWARGKKRVGPGPNNPMGRAKMQFDDYLYVHGSAKENELGGAYSHGCIRLSNSDALDLARLLAINTGVLTGAEIDALEADPRRTRSVRLEEPIPIRIRYGLDGEEAVNLDDPYGWGDRSRPVSMAPGLQRWSDPSGAGAGRSPVALAEARS